MSLETKAPGLLKALFTEQDNETWCPVRLFGVGFAIIGSTVYFVLAIYTVMHLKQPLRYEGLSTGMLKLWGVVSAAVVFKSRFGDRK